MVVIMIVTITMSVSIGILTLNQNAARAAWQLHSKTLCREWYFSRHINPNPRSPGRHPDSAARVFFAIRCRGPWRVPPYGGLSIQSLAATTRKLRLAMAWPLLVEKNSLIKLQWVHVLHHLLRLERQVRRPGVTRTSRRCQL